MQKLTYSSSLFLVNLFLFLFFFNCYTAGQTSAKNGMVVSAEKIASQVGLDILKKGGNAIDAAVATGFALAVTYPVAGNIGGGGFMVIHLATGKDVTIDYREKAPALAAKNMYLDAAGNFIEDKSQIGVLAGGVPGSVAGMLDALQKYGTMSAADVIQPAINLAENGFVLDESIATSLVNYQNAFRPFPSTMKIFSKNASNYKKGDTLFQKDLAATLKRIAKDGKDGFYKGETASIIEKFMLKQKGLITSIDLEDYKSIEREPVVGSYKGNKIISMPPPSSGGIALIELLNICENFKFTPEEWNSSRYIHILSEAMKYVYADRAEHLGDPDFYKVPTIELISKKYAQQIAKKITDSATAQQNVKAGIFNRKESEQTTHYSVYDKFGNAVSVTTTLNSGYGSKLVIEGAGFFLNNEMDDFSAKPGTPNQFGLLGSEANSIEPGKRMLSSMTPTIVLKDNKPFLILGSPGGSTIITVVFEVIMNCIEFEMSLESSVFKPRFHHQLYPNEIYFEKFGVTADVINVLHRKGHKLGHYRSLGLVEAIKIDPVTGEITGCSDNRGNGLAIGY